jgi:hypothetical protein
MKKNNGAPKYLNEMKLSTGGKKIIKNANSTSAELLFCNYLPPDHNCFLCGNTAQDYI